MEWLYTILLGVIQGITEFLPISSSGHLWLVEQFILHQPANISFITLLHVASAIAVIWVLRKKLVVLIQSLYRADVVDEAFYNRRLAWQLVFVTLVTGIVGLMLKKFVGEAMSQTKLAWGLTFTSLIIFVSQLVRPKTEVQSCSWLIMALLGVMQGLAALPGVSRSGMTIGLLFLLGVSEKRSVEVSYLLSIPANVGSFLLFLPELSLVSTGSTIVLLSITCLITMVLSYFALSFLRNHLSKIWVLSGIWCVCVAGWLTF